MRNLFRFCIMGFGFLVAVEAGEYSINEASLKRILPTSPILQSLTLSPDSDDTAFVLTVKGRTLQPLWGKLDLDINDLAKQKKESQRGIVITEHLAINIYNDKYGLVGQEGSNLTLKGNLLSFEQTSFVYKDTLTLQPLGEPKSFVREIILRKLPGCDYPLIQGKFDFTQKGWDVFSPLPGMDFMAIGVALEMVIDTSRL